MQNRNIALCVVLSILTCGIYGIYWYYQIASDFENQQPPLQNKLPTSPALTVLIMFLTCGIYMIYVVYVWGKATPELMARYGLPAEDRSIMYLLLSIFGLQIVSICLIQNDLNSLTTIPPQYPGYPPTAPGPDNQGGSYTQAPPPNSPYNG